MKACKPACHTPCKHADDTLSMMNLVLLSMSTLQLGHVACTGGDHAAATNIIATIKKSRSLLTAPKAPVCPQGQYLQLLAGGLLNTMHYCTQHNGLARQVHACVAARTWCASNITLQTATGFIHQHMAPACCSAYQDLI